MNLLHIDSSARNTSVSRQLTGLFVGEWMKANPDGQVVRRDLSTTSLPQITDDWNATFVDPSTWTSEQRDYLGVSDALIEELGTADVIVIGAPMYNSSISASLKSWIDQIVRAGKTVAYGPRGPRGLLEGKKVIVITARGGNYAKGSHSEAYDFQEPYLRHIFGVIGITDVSFIHVEKQLRAEAQQAFADAAEQVRTAAQSITPASVHVTVR